MNKTMRIVMMIILFIIGFILLGRQVQAANEDALIWVDFPVENELVEGKMIVQGWMMSNHREAQIKILIDNKVQSESVFRMFRPDVLAAIQDYGGKLTNTRPGYMTEIDVSGLEKGMHTVTIQVLNQQGNKVIKEKKVTIRVGIYDSLIWVDSPNSNQTQLDKMQINGWILSEKANVNLETYIDGVKVTNTIARQARPDVLNAISGYGGSKTNKTPGYQIKDVDISNLKTGKHKLELKLATKEGTILEEKQVDFTIRKPDTLLNLDTPLANAKVKDKMTIQGWVLSEDKNDKIQIEMAGNTYEVERQERQDVLNAVSGFGEKAKNPTPGYLKEIDMSHMKDGKYTFTVKVISSKGEILKEENRTVQLQKYDAFLNVDTPTARQKVKNKVEVQGWVLSEDRNDKIQVEIAGVNYEVNRQARQDVLNAISGYGGSSTNPHPGYKTTIDVTNLKDGQHEVKIKVLAGNTNEILKQQNILIQVKKYEGLVNIDYPNNTMINTKNVTVQGWTMSENTNDQVKIYIDNTLVSSSPNRYARQDVINAVSGYGGLATNPTPGFTTNIDVSKFSAGKHTLKVDIVSNLGDVIASGQKTIQIYNDVYFGIDVSKWQGVINFDALQASGKLDFMIARAAYYSETRGKLMVDEQFERNYAQAKARNIPIGTYLYSYATSVEEAKREGEALVEYFKSTGKSFQLPVFFDLEDPSQDGLSTQTRTNMCNAFGQILEANGYKVGIYASKYWLTSKIDLGQIPDRYDIWAASFGKDDGFVPDDKYQYKGNHDIWQYTSKGKIEGINGDVDFNICYKKYW